MRARRLVVLGLCATAAPVLAAQLLPDTAMERGPRRSALSVSVFTAPYWGTGPGAAVLIGAEVHGLAQRRSQDARRLPRQVHVRYDVTGGPSALQGRTVTVRLDDAASRRQAMDEGVRVLTRPTFPPGRYQLRITAIDSSTGLVGSAIHDFEVPGFVEPSPITMSGLVLTSSHAGGVTHAEVEDDSRLLPILAQPPSARREFSQAERIEVHAEFYERPLELEFDQHIDVVTRVLAPDGRLVWETRDVGQSEMLPGGRFGYAHSALVPIDTFTPGRYVLQVGAETQYGVPAFVSRSVAFTVIG